jgi:hypothetical protein
VLADEQNLDETLCNICSITDFPYLFEHYDEKFGDQDYTLHKGPICSVGYVRHNQTCRFCHLIIEAFSNNELFAAAHDGSLIIWDALLVFLDESPRDAPCTFSKRKHKHPRPMNRVPFILKENSIMFMGESERRDLEIFRSYRLVVLADEAQDAPEADVNAHNRGCGRRYQDLIDFKLVKSWLHSCEKCHQSCRQA